MGIMGNGDFFGKENPNVWTQDSNLKLLLTDPFNSLLDHQTVLTVANQISVSLISSVSI